MSPARPQNIVSRQARIFSGEQVWSRRALVPLILGLDLGDRIPLPFRPLVDPRFKRRVGSVFCSSGILRLPHRVLGPLGRGFGRVASSVSFAAFKLCLSNDGIHDGMSRTQGPVK